VDTDPIRIHGAIYGELVNLAEAAGGKLAMFVVEAGANLQSDTLDVIASIEIEVDGEGNAAGPLYAGFPPDTDVVYFPDIDDALDMYAAVDMNGDLSGHGNDYNDPYDFGMVDWSTPPYAFTYDGSTEEYTFTANLFAQMSGILVQVANAHANNGKDVYFALTNQGGDPGVPADVQGVGELQIASGEGIATLLNDSGTFAWGNSAGFYDLHIYIDVDGSGSAGPNAGDMAAMRSVDYQDQPTTETFDGGDFTEIVPPAASGDGVYSELHAVVQTPNITGESFTADLSNTDVAAFEPAGTVVLRADFTDGDDPGPRPWLNCDYSQPIDLSGITNLFSINATHATAAAFFTMNVNMWDGTGTMSEAGINTHNYTPVVNGDWQTFTIPIADLVGVTSFDPTYTTQITIGWPKDNADDSLACTIYFDDIWLE
jgi:hypothetical protein